MSEGDDLWLKFLECTLVTLVLNDINVWSSPCSIKFDIQAGKESFVDFSTGPEATCYKGKNGHLMVVSSTDSMKITFKKTSKGLI